MRIIAIYLVAIAALAFTEKDKLTGRWQTKASENGNVTSAIFKEDKTFEGFVNRKPFVSGKYEVNDDLFIFTDNGCNGAEGKYKMIFFSYNDSLRFEAVSDDCVDRKQGMQRLVFGRIK